MHIRNFSDAHNALRKFYGATGEKRYTLDRMRRLMDYLDNPQEHLRVVHVAGTSGKTSTAYYAAALLQQAGFKAGLTVSPHVDEVNERVQINLQPLEEHEFCQALQEFLDRIEQSGIQPSYFELMIALAFHEFVKQGVDYAIVEVGLGGLLDPTNVVSREDKLCIITDIGLDHMEVLGNTLADIAAQKAGIVQASNHVFMYEQTPEVMQSVARTMKPKSATLHLAPPLSLPETNTLPFFQQRNFGLAACATSFLLDRDKHNSLTTTQRQSAATIRIPARMEQIPLQKGVLIIDGAHNAQKIGELLKSIRGKFGNQPIAALTGFTASTESRWQQALDVLVPEVTKLILTSFPSEQDVPKTSVDPAQLAEYCVQTHQFTSCITESNPQEAYHKLQNDDAPLKLVVGSFYLLNHIRPLL